MPKVESAENNVVLNLNKGALAEIKDSNFNLLVESSEVKFYIPKDKVDKINGNIEFNVKALNSSTNYMKYRDKSFKPLKVLDISVKVDKKSFDNSVELSIPLGDLTQKNIMVGVIENDKWKKLKYNVEDGKMVFLAPHFSVYSVIEYTSEYEDISDNWAKKYIDILSARGIVNGKSEKIFDPNCNITRAEFTKLIVEYLNLSGNVNENYLDVNKEKWYYDVVGLARMNGILDSSEKYFNPEEYITREDMAIIISNAYKKKYGFELTGEGRNFLDDDEISEYAKLQVYAMRYNGIITGYEDNTFKPKGYSTRSEAIKIIYEFINH